MKIDNLGTQYGVAPKETKRNTGEMGKDDFLRLFVEQIKTQDPLSPMDNNQFVAQSAQFTQLEQLTNLNTNINAFLEKQSGVLTTFLHSQTSGQALNLVDKHVTAYIKGQDGGFTKVEGLVEKVTFGGGLPMIHVAGYEVFMEEIAEVSVVRPTEVQ